MNCFFSSALIWLGRLPSVAPRNAFSALKSSVSLTANAGMMPNLTRLSNALYNPSIANFTSRIDNDVDPIDNVQYTKADRPTEQPITDKTCADEPERDFH